MQILRANSGAQVKLFFGFTNTETEKKLNAWLSENDKTIEIYDISIAGKESSFCVMVVYRTPNL